MNTPERQLSSLSPEEMRAILHREHAAITRQLRTKTGEAAQIHAEIERLQNRLAEIGQGLDLLSR
ncbi:Uncharacterised protein [Mycobacteroides abscessus subsp. bolletii]|uniref:hypothetical protein n=1 Tax=Mycobacteroides abscessus TaxID=36809 RepID=UPI0009A5BA64|nr:hypothetical protein [Mycobacteroides abscessus]SKY98918.1 Uncharacterised protein [Mycobacteroides abscessus subsp. bolletii]